MLENKQAGTGNANENAVPNANANATPDTNGGRAINRHLRHASLEDGRSDEVQEIMGRMPPWILRSGITLIAVLVLGAFVAAWFFRYPEVIAARVVLMQSSYTVRATMPEQAFHTVKGTMPASGAWKVKPEQFSYTVKGTMSASGAWKVKTGQKALIRLTAYPYEEYGLLQGTVMFTEANMTDTNFQVSISLDHLLHTTTGKEIPVQPRLDGTAEIMTEDKSVLQRMFGRLWRAGE